ncbi:MAG: hypothetical protein EHM58_04355 [Ignavibacteriae bacterium]|nr:MAG: hypothetical protein EHM58_04355 [Ignavibacteriota bacterium]
MVLGFLYLLSTFFTFQTDSLVYKESIGDFKNAAAISSSREDLIFITDIQLNKIYKYSLTGKLLGTFGGTGFNLNSLDQPVAIDASNGLDVFVCDYQNNRIQRYDINLNLVGTFSLNSYNLTAENSGKIYYPNGIAFLNTSEVFIIADAANYKAAKLKALEEVSNLFANSNIGLERLGSPSKIVRGSNLDVWILDKDNSDIINFDNYGTYVRRLKNPDKDTVISITYNSDNLYILKSSSIAVYDLKLNKYTAYHKYDGNNLGVIKDLAVLNKNNVLILSNIKIHKYIIQ